MKDNQSYIRLPIFIVFSLFISLTFCLHPVFSQNSDLKKVLYLNSYNVTYSWSDSITSGVVKTMAARPDVLLYIEYLDANRFGTSNFENLYKLYKEKYSNVSFDVILVSDNDALDFINKYGEQLAPHVPVIFCGVNNIQDYPLKEKPWFYGIKEEVDQSLVLKVILDIIPSVKTLYFINDSTTTNLVLNRYIKEEIEPRFSSRVEFVYIYSANMDSLLQRISSLNAHSAIAMVNFVRDSEGKPVNQDVLFQKVLALSKVPVFTGTEALLGKGVIGGVINKGSTHGRSMATLALKFIDHPGYKPAQRIYMPDLHYYFDYNVLKKFNIDESLLPNGSVIINKPLSLKDYLKYIIALVVFASFQALIIFYLIINIGRRRRAEQNVLTKYEEIQKQNKQLEDANDMVNNMNARLEELNENLSESNQALVVAKQRAEDADKLKSSFLANMSHEIRTPLNAIIGFSTLSADTSFSESKRNYFIQVAKSNSDQLLRLIDDILDLSKIESGQIQVVNEIFSVNDILLELYTSAKHSLTNTNVDLRISPYAQNNQLMMKSDPIRFKQIVSNLLANAIKFTEEGFIELGFSIENQQLIFYVKDTGMGIRPENLSNIFERFWKTEGNDERLFSGTGLGLAICKKFCELLGGSIWVESVLNSGTTFYFTLSNIFYIRHPEPESLPSVTESPEQNWENYTIAIAEDEESNLQYLKESLRKSGIRIYSFGDGTDIVDFFANKPPQKIDVVLMDIKMPKMDGFTAAKLIKEKYPYVPIIAQTAYAMVSDIKMIKDSEFDDFITKPIRPQVLIEKIAQFLGKK
ncbi:MAG TPA: ATP-binding protein [Bacteroidales bacterium]|nr:ATP-binding protein [Bacteroidales bacterium]